MDPLTEFVLLSALLVGIPYLVLRTLYRAIVRHICELAPDPVPPRYHLVQVIPQRKQAPTSKTGAWWPSESWPPRGW